MMFRKLGTNPAVAAGVAMIFAHARGEQVVPTEEWEEVLNPDFHSSYARENMTAYTHPDPEVVTAVRMAYFALGGRSGRTPLPDMPGNRLYFSKQD